MTKVFFVRHAEPEHSLKEDRTRPLTQGGKNASKRLLGFFIDKKKIEHFCVQKDFKEKARADKKN